MAGKSSHGTENRTEEALSREQETIRRLAHDLNNLLAPIVMGVSVLKRFEKQEKMLAIILNIERAANRAADLVREVLSSGQRGEGSRSFVPSDDAPDFVRDHEAGVSLKGELGEGTSSRVTLSAGTEAGVTGSSIPKRDARSERGGGLILVVDDEEFILGIIQQTLESAGCRVLLARDGAQAIALYVDHRDEIDLVITDMIMPVINGPALIAALRAINPQVEVLAMSGLDAEANEEKHGSAGVSAFLQKPFSADRLLSLLRPLLPELGAPGPDSD
jgi:CheY-like chemotaxis protein